MINVPVPKNLSGIKTKIILNLTKRQLICFSIAGGIGVPIYFYTRNFLGTSMATLLMVIVMLPFFFVAMYQRDGFYAEKIFKDYLNQRYIRPGIRPYKSENKFKLEEKRERIKKEVSELEEKAERNIKSKRPK